MPTSRQKGWKKVHTSEIPVTDLVKQFVMSREDLNHSPRTVQWYDTMLRRFASSLGSNARLGDINSESVRNFQRCVRESGKGKFTVHAYARSPKTFLRWLRRREGYVDRPVDDLVQMPKVPKYDDVAIEVLNEDEITRLLAALNPNTDVGSRNRAIVCLMLESGLRLGEVASLKLEDVHAKETKGESKGEHYGPRSLHVPHPIASSSFACLSK